MPNLAPAAVERSVKDAVERILCEWVGPRTAATAVKIASRTWLRTEPDALVPSQLLGLTQGLAPLLERLLGPEQARLAVARILEGAAAR